MINRLKKNPALFKRFTGITIKQFNKILFSLHPIYMKHEHARLKKKNRKRSIGGGSQFTYALEDRVLIVLLYYKLYITHEFLGLLFRLDNSNIGRTIGHLSPLLAKIFRIPERKIKLSSEDKDRLIYFFVDCTEQPINRPKKNQKKHYSGKKKRHTIKWQIVTKDGKTIDAISKSYPGQNHDKKIYDLSSLHLPPNSRGIGDTGYAGTSLVQPVKKKKGQQRTKSHKKYNRKISKLRVKAEHALSAMKRFRIVRDVYRNIRNSHNLYAKNVAGLVNLSAS